MIISRISTLIIYTKSFDKGLKKLKKHNEEINNLNKILKIIKNTSDFRELTLIPIIKKYNFERLKHNYNDFYSFRLSRTIRLIVKPKENEIELYLAYISFYHYDDFSVEKVIYYD